MQATLSETSTRTCCRCGSKFPTVSNRVCGECTTKAAKAKALQPLNPKLSFRETQIADLVAKAKLNKEIAWELALTEGTIKEYLNRIFKKLGLSSRTELAVWRLNHPS